MEIGISPFEQKIIIGGIDKINEINKLFSKMNKKFLLKVLETLRIKFDIQCKEYIFYGRRLKIIIIQSVIRKFLVYRPEMRPGGYFFYLAQKRFKTFK